jgi:hypothetical protein
MRTAGTLNAAIREHIMTMNPNAREPLAEGVGESWPVDGGDKLLRGWMH